MIVGDIDRAELLERMTSRLTNALSLPGGPSESLTEAEWCEAAAEVLGFGRRTMASAWYLAARLVRLDRL